MRYPNLSHIYLSGLQVCIVFLSCRVHSRENPGWRKRPSGYRYPICTKEVFDALFRHLKLIGTEDAISQVSVQPLIYSCAEDHLHNDYAFKQAVDANFYPHCVDEHPTTIHSTCCFRMAYVGHEATVKLLLMRDDARVNSSSEHG